MNIQKGMFNLAEMSLISLRFVWFKPLDFVNFISLRGGGLKAQSETRATAAATTIQGGVGYPFCSNLQLHPKFFPNLI